MRMDPDSLIAYLAQPLVANLVTLRSSGSPHVAPVWFSYSGGKFQVYTSRNLQKAHNIERDNRVALSVATCGTPYSYVLVEGSASITNDRAAEIGRAIATRYMGADRAGEVDEFITNTLDGNSVIIEITPARIMTWTEG